MRWSAAVCAIGVVAIGCASAGAQVFHSSAGDVVVETVAKSLDHPWALAFLPAGRMLVTERPGRMRIVAKDGALSPALGGVPKVFASGQGGLHDVVLDRGFAQNHTIYLCYAEPVDGRGRTALARGRLVDEGTPRLDAVEVIFRQAGPLSSGNHFGCRIAQAPDDSLFLTTGDHFTTRDQAQNLANDLGKIVRIRPDGSAPPDNPFVGKPPAKPEIWSYGHRNPQGLAFHPVTGKLWEHEHGPRGGDEINLIEKGKNYGWPLAGYAPNYNGVPVPSFDTRPELTKPAIYWTPVVAPGNLMFYKGKNTFPQWDGSGFISGMGTQSLNRFTLDGKGGATMAERWAMGKRIRDVAEAPDGSLWLLEDANPGALIHVTPK